MSKKEQLLNILNLLVVFGQQDYSTNEAAEDILKLFNISDEEIKETSRRINYSEKEVLEILAQFVNDEPHITKEWFEQFKNRTTDTK